MRALLERGDDVRVLDNFSTGNRAKPRGRPTLEIVEGELRSYERVHNAVRGVELVFHLGALGSVPRSVQDPLTSSAVNVEGTLNVLLAARDEGVRRVVFASSSSVYGNAARAAADRGHGARPDLPVRRREARRGALLRQLQPRLRRSRPSCSATSTSSVRARSPRSQYAAIVPLFITAIAAGSRSRSTATASSRATSPTSRTSSTRTSAPPTRGGQRRIFNVSAGAPTTVNELADTIGRVLDSPVERRHGRRGPATSAPRGRTSAPRASCSAGSRRIGLEEGLRLTAEYLALQPLAEPVRILRVIARLNMGGPALHVAYLTAGPRAARLRDDARRRAARPR